jgi:hypothetical protein
VSRKNTRQRSSLPSEKKHSAKLPSVFLALGKELICRVPEKEHSANHLALGKVPFSGSGGAQYYHAATYYIYPFTLFITF